MSRVVAKPATTINSLHSDDGMLVARLVRGDGAAWQQFVPRYGRILRARVADVATTFGRGHDDSGIDDVTAEVFAALLTNDAAALRGYRGRSALGTYLAVIATRVATRQYSGKRNTPTCSTDVRANEAAADLEETDPLGRLLRSERDQNVRELLKRLPNKQRDVVTLYHLEGRSYTYISDTLKMPVGSIGVTLRRAEAKLREWIEGD